MVLLNYKLQLDLAAESLVELPLCKTAARSDQDQQVILRNLIARTQTVRGNMSKKCFDAP